MLLFVLPPASRGVNASLPLLAQELQRESGICKASHFIGDVRLLGHQLKGGSQIKSRDRVSQRLCSRSSGSY